jgi:hypothetical protein
MAPKIMQRQAPWTTPRLGGSNAAHPPGWSLEQHLSNPTVNCTNGDEMGHAHTVASMVRLGG